MRDIEKYHRSGSLKTYVLRHVNLDVDKGEFLSIMGPSGAGKSTLLHIMGMLDEPTAGEYRFLGKQVAGLSEKERTEVHRRHIGFVFQAYHLIDEQTVYENLEMPLLYQQVKRSERRARVSELLDRFRMVAKKDLFPHQLSGGEQQRVGVARALIGRPALILADEPTGNLNSKRGDEVTGATPVRWTVKCFRQVGPNGAVVEWEYPSPGARVEHGAPVGRPGPVREPGWAGEHRLAPGGPGRDRFMANRSRIRLPATGHGRARSSSAIRN